MLNIKIIILYTLALLLSLQTMAQDDETTKLRDGEFYGTTIINGTIVKVLIIDGDTLPVIDLDDLQVTRKRNFKDRGERQRYHRWRKYAAKVYPYAAEAIELYRKVEEDTENMKKGKKRKYGRKKEKELRPKYQEEIKKLTKTQGFILIKMVERELDKPFYEVIKYLEGGWKAMQWQALGKFYGYNLKTGYDAKKDPLLENILDDLNISYGNK